MGLGLGELPLGREHPVLSTLEDDVTIANYGLSTCERLLTMVKQDRQEVQLR